MNKYLILLIGMMLFVSCKTQTADPVNTSEKVENQATIQLIDVAKLKAAIDANNIQLIDVRTPEEYAEGHIENALNIDFLADDFSKAILKANMDSPVYIYCRSGTRSGQAAKQMQALGFKTIYDLKGGFLAWD